MSQPTQPAPNPDDELELRPLEPASPRQHAPKRIFNDAPPPAATESQPRVLQYTHINHKLSVTYPLAIAFIFALPVASWFFYLLIAKFVLKSQQSIVAANTMTVVATSVTLILFGAMAVTGKIFGGFDLPSIPNRVWKTYAIVAVELIIFLLLLRPLNYMPCFLFLYFIIGRSAVLGLGLRYFFNLDFFEAAITTLMVWLVVGIALIPPSTRHLIVPTW
jgi:hypothetical protein